jgi:hypothetical protein
MSPQLVKAAQLYTPRQMAMLEEAIHRTGETDVDPMNIAATRAWREVERSPEWEREQQIGRTGAGTALGMMGAGMLGGGYGGYRAGRLIGMGGLGAGVGAVGGGILGGALAQPVVKKLQERKREKMKTGGFAEKLQRKAGILAYKKVTGQLPHVPPKLKEKRAALAAFIDELGEIHKAAALGVDLRLVGPGGVRRPPFATEGSKQLALSRFKETQKPGNIGVKKPPEPKIRPVATLPQH